MRHQYQMSGFIDGTHQTLPLPSVEVALEWLTSGRVKYPAVEGLCICPVPPFDEQGRQTYPRLLVTHHADHGTSVLLMRWEGGDVLVTTHEPIGEPEVPVFIPPNTHELWPRALFVGATVAERAIRHALESSQPDRTLDWVGLGDFPRTGPGTRRDVREPC